LSICNNSNEPGGGTSAVLPGPKRRQAEALFQNLKWLAEQAGDECIGFLTLTFADGVTSREEASRRFNSVLTGVLRARYRRGVVVAERTKRGVIHFHLVVDVGKDIRGKIDFEECFPPSGRGNYRTANRELKEEWRWLRETLGRYGFGRHQLQPMKSNAEALARYVGKYVSKSWEHRTEDDKGARLIRYFGQWMNAGKAPPWTARHGGLSARAVAWRNCMKQIAVVCRETGINLTESNAREAMGRRWAWFATKKIRGTEFIPDPRAPGITEHNSEVSELAEGHHWQIWRTKAEHWIEHDTTSDAAELAECRRANAHACACANAFDASQADWESRAHAQA